jgi:hypothetical protein
MNTKPSSEDIVKIHAEINQYINQKLIITTTSITIFGVVMGWVVFGLSSTQIPDIQMQPESFLLPTALLVILAIMLWYCQEILKQMHVLSTYLCATDSSVWEKQYRYFSRSEEYTTQEKLPLIVFATLGILTITIPIVISFLFPPSLSFQMGMVLASFILSSVAYVIVFSWFWNQRKYEKYRENVADYWERILASDKQA